MHSAAVLMAAPWDAACAHAACAPGGAAAAASPPSAASSGAPSGAASDSGDAGAAGAGADAVVVAAAAASAARVLAGTRDLPLESLKQVSARRLHHTSSRRAAAAAAVAAAIAAAGGPPPPLEPAAEASSGSSSSSSPNTCPWPAGPAALAGAGAGCGGAAGAGAGAGCGGAAGAAAPAAPGHTESSAASAAGAAAPRGAPRRRSLSDAAPPRRAPAKRPSSNDLAPRVQATNAAAAAASMRVAQLQQQQEALSASIAKRLRPGETLAPGGGTLAAPLPVPPPAATAAAAPPGYCTPHYAGTPPPFASAAMPDAAPAPAPLAAPVAAPPTAPPSDALIEPVPGGLACWLNLPGGCSVAAALHRLRELAAAGVVPAHLLPILELRLNQRLSQRLSQRQAELEAALGMRALAGAALPAAPGAHLAAPPQLAPLGLLHQQAAATPLAPPQPGQGWPLGGDTQTQALLAPANPPSAAAAGVLGPRQALMLQLQREREAELASMRAAAQALPVLPPQQQPQQPSLVHQLAQAQPHTAYAPAAHGQPPQRAQPQHAWHAAPVALGMPPPGELLLATSGDAALDLPVVALPVPDAPPAHAGHQQPPAAPAPPCGGLMDGALDLPGLDFDFGDDDDLAACLGL
jgi:hypothetical protein